MKRKCKIDFTTWKTDALRKELHVVKNQKVPKLSEYDESVITNIQAELDRRIIEVDITEKLALTIWSEDGEQTELYAEVKWYDGNDEQDYYMGHLEPDMIGENTLSEPAKSMAGRLVNVYINKVEKS